MAEQAGEQTGGVDQARQPCLWHPANSPKNPKIPDIFMPSGTSTSFRAG